MAVVCGVHRGLRSDHVLLHVELVLPLYLFLAHDLVYNLSLVGLVRGWFESTLISFFFFHFCLHSLFSNLPKLLVARQIEGLWDSGLEVRTRSCACLALGELGCQQFEAVWVVNVILVGIDSKFVVNAKYFSLSELLLLCLLLFELLPILWRDES